MWYEDKQLDMIFGKGKKYYGRRIGDYRIIGRIGEGRYGVCFLAEKDGKKVIIKKVKSHIFHRKKRGNPCEIQILSELSHPGIPRLLGVVNVKGFYGLVLEQKFGDTIEQLLFKHKHSFLNPEILNIGNQLIGIIKYLHEKGIVHRDIRIPNVLLSGDTISLVDFGLARWVDNKRYIKDVDFSYLGDFLLYLLYSSYQNENHQSQPWYEELQLTSDQKLFLKRLLKIEAPYANADQIADDFLKAFSCDKKVCDSFKNSI